MRALAGRCAMALSLSKLGLKSIPGLSGSLGERLNEKFGGTMSTLTPTSFPIGIDFGTSAMKVLQLGPGEPPALVSAVSIETPEPLLGDPKRRFLWQLSQLGDAVKAGHFKGRKAVCVLPASVTYTKQMQFPKSEGVDIRDLAQTALATQLECDPSAFVMRCVDVGPVGSGAKHEVIGMAVARDFVDHLMVSLKQAKLEPVGMQSEYFAILHAFDYLTRRAEDVNLSSLYLDMGYNSTTVIIAHGRHMVFARAIEHGGRHLDEFIATETRLDLTNARRTRMAMEYLTKRDRELARDNAIIAAVQPPPAPARSGADQAGGTPVSVAAGASFTPADAVGANLDLREPLETLTDDIAMCMRYYDSIFPGRRVDRAIFVGGEARHRGLCQHIARVLRLPAQIADPMARVARTGNEQLQGVSFRDPQPGWAVAMGTCLAPADL